MAECIECGADTDRVFESADQWTDNKGISRYEEFTYAMCVDCEED